MIFLRNLPVNISRYLPKFLQNDASMKDLLDAHSEEHEKLRLLIHDISNQFFVQSATWGLDDWERFLAITPTPESTYSQRRNKILLYLQSHQISTVAFLEKLVQRYLSENSVVKIKEDNPRNIFHIFLERGHIAYYDDLLDGLDTYKPAHLGYDIAMKTGQFFYLNRGGPLVDVITPEKTTVKRVPYIVFTYGLNATGVVETLTDTRTNTTQHEAYIFQSGTTNGKLRLNDTGDYLQEEKDLGRDVTTRWMSFTGSRLNSRNLLYSNDTAKMQKSQTQHIANWQPVVIRNKGTALNALAKIRKAWNTHKTITTAFKRFVAPAYATNRFGKITKHWKDIGQDKIVSEIVFTGGILNGGNPVKIAQTTTEKLSTSYAVFEGMRTNSKNSVVTNQVDSRTQTKETVVTKTVQIWHFTGNLTNGEPMTNNVQKKKNIRTIHISVWRMVAKSEGDALLNAVKHETRYKEIKTVIPAVKRKKYDSEIGMLLNSHAVMGYLRLK